MTVVCPVEVVILEKDSPVEAIFVEKALPVAVVSGIQRGPQGEKGDTGDVGPPGPPGGTIGGNVREELAIAVQGEVSFNLSQVVTNPDLTRVFLNGQKLIYGQGYNFSGSMTVLVFTSGLYELETDDTLEIYYSI